MFNFNKQLATVAILTVASVSGTMLTANHASAQSNNGCTGAVKRIELRNAQNQKVFCSQRGVRNVGKLGKQVTRVSVSGGKWKFYTGKNFTGQSVTVSGETTRNLNLRGGVSSFKAVR
ncbi:hypothetical protein DSM106972_099750 [Dulcicalothrix desertica PCC 7102]|uniref:Beta/gamma crystallin 'Greek key' domain-containing protein n=1 Tax=Dulcicalothrix desertica PCC 7102 TaxID=232991 RepID=A0A3S5K2L1_9CYAN|nr:hypothetical protein [Dulcicalothrix desertica]RUS92238.1 hypothetical protein DSM106972_099750 [Dulcicalothrix desertica PCC 7102]TWH55005.1 hypothetical protein CAL7102_03102 [Dulcicalothrix desertica PCC 7102]